MLLEVLHLRKKLYFLTLTKYVLMTAVEYYPQVGRKIKTENLSVHSRQGPWTNLKSRDCACQGANLSKALSAAHRSLTQHLDVWDSGGGRNMWCFLICPFCKACSTSEKVFFCETIFLFTSCWSIEWRNKASLWQFGWVGKAASVMLNKTTWFCSLAQVWSVSL